MNWQKLGMWLSAVLIYAQQRYPGLDGDMIMHSVMNGTFWFELGSCLSSFFIIQMTNWIPVKLKNEIPE